MNNIETTITENALTPFSEGTPEGCGAVAEFWGIVRGEENGESITALEYEAYRPMAERQMQRIIGELLAEYPCEAVRVIHRIGVIPVGEAAIAVRVASRHRHASFSFLARFMDRLKQDVPIWKVRALTSAHR